ncbi:lipocalin-like domain-containing protein [Rubrivivax rivuli]
MLILFLAVGCASIPPQGQSVQGAWRLVSWETVFKDGTVTHPYGKTPTGFIIYEPSGWMSVQVVRDPMPPVPASGHSLIGATLEEKSAAYSAYYAYWGRYSIDASKSKVSHVLTASLLPHEVGRTYERTFSIEGDRLLLTTPPYRSGGKEAFNRLTWQRLPSELRP